MLCSWLVPAILSEAIPATTQNVQTEIQNTTKLAFTYSGEFNVTARHFGINPDGLGTDLHGPGRMVYLYSQGF